MSKFYKDIMLADLLHCAIVKSGFYELLRRQVQGIDLYMPLTKSAQKLGSDVIITKPDNTKICIDEKAQLHYINNPIYSFTMELGFMYKDNFSEGWFLNDNLNTTHYMFIWLLEAKPYDYISKIDDFYKIHICICSKKSIFEYLRLRGISKEYLRECIKKVIDIPKGVGGKKKITVLDNLEIIQSTKYEENPINLKINYPILKDCSEVNLILDLSSNMIRKVA